jgi:hypothetical protein
VFVEWSVENNLLVPEIIFDRPLEDKGNERARKIINLLESNNIQI